MAKSKKVYFICNPYAYFLFGAYIPAHFYGTDENGAPVWKIADALTYSTKKQAQKVLDGLNSPKCIIMEGE